MSLKYNTFQSSQELIYLPKQGGCIDIQPFGDIHRDADGCNVDKFKSFLAYARELAEKPTTRFIGLGDYNDFASASERQKLHTLHESTDKKMDRWALYDVKRLAHELSFMKGKLIGLMHGNHEWMFQNGKLGTEVLCELLECPFLGYASYVRIKVLHEDKRFLQNIGYFDIFGSHGKGGGQLIGSPYNSLEKMDKIFPSADIYLMGHDHKKGALSRSVLEYNSHFRQTQKRQWFGRTGSFLEGWVEDEPNYIIPRMYAPTDLGIIRFECYFKRKQVLNENGKRKDLYIKDIHCWS
jgi:hypothetical protein